MTEGKTPTPIQVRELYKKIVRAEKVYLRAIRNAIAHNVIVYEPDKWREQSPTHPIYEASERVRNCTEKQLATAMRAELEKGIKW